MRASERGFRRLVVVSAAVAAALVSAGGGTAHASALSRATARVQALLPHSSAAASAVDLALQSRPVTVTINSTSYVMRVTIDRSIGFPGAQPFGDVSLIRASGSAEQDHDYSFFPQSGFAFTANRTTLQTASIDSGSSIDPSQMTMTYSASGAQTTTTCRLANGGVGTIRHTNGTIAASSFSIVTPTSPFFGTITTPPVRARLTLSPDCFVPRPPTRPVCAGRETINGGRSLGAPFAFDLAEVGFHGKHAFEADVRGDFGPTASTDHDIIAIVPGSDITGSHWPGGASSTWYTTGNPFMSGRAHFTSRQAPVVRTHKACVWEGALHHFDSWRYRGRLTANPTTGFTALYDTGQVALDNVPTTVIYRRYTS